MLPHDGTTVLNAQVSFGILKQYKKKEVKENLFMPCERLDRYPT